VLATSDVPAGVVGVLTGRRDELAPHLASHLDVDALDLDTGSEALERSAAENVKRVVFGRADTQSPYEISSFLELKTVWHPMGQ
jgi:acyl-CoA reductase-like NAD-dependent aldehyde dehydrogenase